MNIDGKTVAKVARMKKPEYDDSGWLKLEFTDGTFCVIVACYGDFTGDSEGEYPTTIGISDSDEGLIPSN